MRVAIDGQAVDGLPAKVAGGVSFPTSVPSGVIVLDKATIRNGHLMVDNAWRRLRAARNLTAPSLSP